MFKKRPSILGKRSKFETIVSHTVKDDDDLDVLFRHEKKFHVVLLNAKKNMYKQI